VVAGKCFRFRYIVAGLTLGVGLASAADSVLLAAGVVRSTVAIRVWLL